VVVLFGHSTRRGGGPGGPARGARDLCPNRTAAPQRLGSHCGPAGLPAVGDSVVAFRAFRE
jgi:hypothetical protein